MHQSVQLNVRAMEIALVERVVFQKMSLNVVLLARQDIADLVCWMLQSVQWNVRVMETALVEKVAIQKVSLHVTSQDIAE
jgi:hypothetical protein